MKFLALAALCSPLALAVSLPSRPSRPAAEPRVVGLEFRRNDVADPLLYDRERLRRRDRTVSASLDNQVCYGI